MGGRVFAVVESPAEENGGGGVCAENAWGVAGDSRNGGYFLPRFLVKCWIVRPHEQERVHDGKFFLGETCELSAEFEIEDII